MTGKHLGVHATISFFQVANYIVTTRAIASRQRYSVFKALFLATSRLVFHVLVLPQPKACTVTTTGAELFQDKLFTY
jgi:hypothetical protein